MENIQFGSSDKILFTPDDKVAFDCGGDSFCGPCNTPQAPSYNVTIAGYGNSSCSECTTLNGTFNLTQTSSCGYAYSYPGIICGCPGMGVSLHFRPVDFIPGIGAHIQVIVTSGSDCFPPTSVFRKVYASLVDCENLEDEDIPLLSSLPGGSGSSNCTNSGRTCSVSDAS